MSEPAIPLDPFIQITDLHFPSWRWRFSFFRDDGLVYTPVATESLTILLYTEGGTWLFTGQSVAVGAALPYTVAMAGLVKSFLYQDGYYAVVLNRTVWEALLGPVTGRPACRLVTEGVHTLTTRYPRGYLAEDLGTPILPGVWAVTLPFWSVTTTESYPDLVTTVQQTVVQSSIPYEATYRLYDVNTYAWFMMPVLGVVYAPNPMLTDWIGALQVDHLCDWGPMSIPWQVTGMVRPANPPTDPAERIYMTDYNIPLLIAMGPCAGKWPGTVIAVTTDFGCQESLSFSPRGAPKYSADYPLGAQAITLSGKLFTRQYQFQWDRNSFVYKTSEGALLYPPQTATLIQSPATFFESLLLQPLPEQGV